MSFAMMPQFSNRRLLTKRQTLALKSNPNIPHPTEVIPLSFYAATPSSTSLESQAKMA